MKSKETLRLEIIELMNTRESLNASVSVDIESMLKNIGIPTLTEQIRAKFIEMKNIKE